MIADTNAASRWRGWESGGGGGGGGGNLALKGTAGTRAASPGGGGGGGAADPRPKGGVSGRQLALRSAVRGTI